MFSCPLQIDDDQANIKKVTKLHKQFAHPRSIKLKELIRKSGVKDKGIEQIVDTVSDNCDICKRFRRPPLRPVVAFPLASEFNEVVAMDLKFIERTPILHLIDHATRYSMACRVRNKMAETIVESVITNWIRVFGHPSKYFLTDNGGEFSNSDVTELCEKFNLELNTTAAEAAWSNGMVERHHTMLADNVRKVTDDNNCSLDLAIAWSVSAKNSLSNVYGFSPNQLVFGRNINLPAVHHDRLSAQNETCKNATLARHLIALHKTRQAFISQESCEKLRRALNRQVRNFSDIQYQIGDKVYYKRNSNHEWRGPAKILGCDKSQYLLKHGGNYVRVHPCKLQLIESNFQETCTPTNSTDNHKVDVFTQCENAIVDDDDDVVSDDSDIVDAQTPYNTMPTPPCTPLPPQASNNLDHSVINHNNDVSVLENGLSPGVNVPGNLNLGIQHEGNSNVNQQSKDDKVGLPRAVERLLDYNNPGRQDKTSVTTRSIKLRSQNEASQDEENPDNEVYFGSTTNPARYDKA